MRDYVWNLAENATFHTYRLKRKRCISKGRVEKPHTPPRATRRNRLNRFRRFCRYALPGDEKFSACEYERISGRIGQVIEHEHQRNDSQ